MLSIAHVNKTFGSRRVLTDVTFDVGRGRMTGFVGGNGAGKTTAMRIILGVLRPEQGTVSLDGQELVGESRRSFGYMPEERGLYPKMEIAEQLTYLGRLHGYHKQTATQRADELLDRLGLAERRKDKLEALSLGNQQRVQVAAALVHEPDVLVLDEPFSGLDPLAVDEVVAVIAEHAARGIPVLFSSHQLEVVERLCDDLVIIAGGEIKAAGTRAQLQEAHAGHRYEVITRSDAGWVAGLPGIEVVELAGDTLLFTADEAAADQVAQQVAAQGQLRSFRPVRPTLGQIFRDIVVDAPRHEAELTATGAPS